MPHRTSIRIVITPCSPCGLSQLRRSAAATLTHRARAALAALGRSRAAIEAAIARGETIYGVNTGFGKLANVRIAPGDLDQLQANLIRSHAAGVGAPLPEDVVRAMMILRANVLLRPTSGVRPDLVRALLAFVSAGLASFVWVIPHMTLNSKVLFDVYILALLLASLRYDWRLTALAGGLATVQYAGLALWVGSTYDLNSPSYAPYLQGTFSWPIQAGRVLLLRSAAVAPPRWCCGPSACAGSRPPTAWERMIPF